MEWTKAPVAVGTLACAACLAIAGTMTASIPAAQEAARQAQMRLAAVTDIAAFDAIPTYIGILQALAAGDIDAAIDLLGNLDSTSAVPVYRDIAALLAEGDIEGAIDALADLDSTSAVPVYKDIAAALAEGDIEGAIDLLVNLDSTSAVPVYKHIAVALAEGDIEGAIDELGGLDSTSAVPVYKDIAVALAEGDLQEAANQTGNLDSVSAIDTFVGDGPEGADGVTPVGSVFGDGGVDALAPHTDDDGNQSGGYAALSALPVLAGSNKPNTNFGPGLLNPQANGTGGLAALENYDALSAVPRYLNLPPNDAPPLPEPEPAPLAKTSSSDNKQGEVRESLKFTPDFGGIPLFGSGKGNGVDNGIRGYGDMLKKVGLNGGEAASPSAGDPAGDTGGGEG